MNARLFLVSEDGSEKVPLLEGANILGRKSFISTRGDLTVSSKQLSITPEYDQASVSIKNIGLNQVKVNDLVLSRGDRVIVEIGAIVCVKASQPGVRWVLEREQSDDAVLDLGGRQKKKVKLSSTPNTGWLKPQIPSRDDEAKDGSSDVSEEKDEHIFHKEQTIAKRSVLATPNIKRKITVGIASGWLSKKGSSRDVPEAKKIRADQDQEFDEESAVAGVASDLLESQPLGGCCVGFIDTECVLFQLLGEDADIVDFQRQHLIYGRPDGLASDTFYAPNLGMVAPGLGQRLSTLGDFSFEFEFPESSRNCRVVPARVWIISSVELEFPLPEEVVQRINQTLNEAEQKFQPTDQTGRPVITKVFSKVIWTADEAERELEKTFQQLSRTELPMADNPRFLQHSLHPHQRQALYWMQQQEQSNLLPPFFQELPTYSPISADPEMRWNPHSHHHFSDGHKQKLKLVAMCFNRVMKESRIKSAIATLLLFNSSPLLPQFPADVVVLIVRYAAKASHKSLKPMHALIFPRLPIHLRYRHSLSGTVYSHPPRPARGGIMGDDMGLGKTLSMLSLVIRNSGRTVRPPGAAKYDDEVELSNARLCEDDAEVSRILTRRAQLDSTERERLANDAGEGRIPTLIVCPNSVMSNWEGQIQRHCAPGLLRALRFHGSIAKNVTVKDLESFDVVITTYGTITSNKLLKLVAWRRVILDEAHFIRNSRTSVFKAVVALDSIFRWCVTGTPLVNKVSDIHSLVAFLGIAVISSPDVFSNSISRAIKEKAAAGYLRLRMLMLATCLRRTKEQKNEFGGPVVDIPPKSVVIQRVPLSTSMLRTYVGYESRAKDLYRALKKSTMDHRAAFMFLILLRLRQLCLHPQLYPGLSVFFSNAERALQSGDPRALKDAMLGAIPHSCEKCDAPCTRVIFQTPCSHFYCKSCRDEIQLSQSCYVCASAVSTETPILARTPKEKIENAESITSSSDKIKAILGIIKKHNSSDAQCKIVIFSQFTSFLDILSNYFRKRNINVCSLDGRMDMTSRDASMANFSRTGGARIMLASLQCAGVGINLLSANVLILSDPWWNQAVEDQAIDRVHRLGQKKPVFVYRLVAQGTIDERMITLQQGKSQLANVALSLKSKEELENLKVQQMDALFDLEG